MSRFFLLVLLALVPSFATRADGAVLDWTDYDATWGDPVTWSGNQITRTLNVSGFNVQVIITRPANIVVNSTPTINNILPGQSTGNSGREGLNIDLNATSNTQAVTVQFIFQTAWVRDVEFQVFDIDRANNNNPESRYQDQVTVVGQLGVSGSTLFPSATGSAQNLVSGANNNIVTGNTLFGVGNENDNTGNANATFDFGTQTIDRFTLTYTNGPLAPANPTLQRISIFNIEFTPVPEPGTWAMIGVATLLGAMMLWRKSRRHTCLQTAARTVPVAGKT